MRTASIYLGIGLIGLVLAGCATTEHAPAVTQRTVADRTGVIEATYSAVGATGEDVATKKPDEQALANRAADAPALTDLIGIALERNPALAKVGWAVEEARGRAVQAGLYPNPTVDVTGNELGDRTGPSGIWSVYTSQEIVTANKLGLSQAAALKQVDQASLDLIAERYRVFTDIRQAFFDALTMQRRAEILADLVELAEQSVENANKLLKAKVAAELDVVQLEVDLERYRADLEAAQRGLPGAYRKLASAAGIEDMHISALKGDLDAPLPDYDLEQARQYVRGIHPAVRSAKAGVERAKLVLCRAEAESIPNVTVGAGYTHQGQNRSSDWDIGVSVPLPTWNKNQGNIRAAQARVQAATTEVSRVENELVIRLATAHSTYARTRERSERYRTAILPRAQRTYELSQKAYRGGQFEYLRVLQAQRAVTEANLELVRSLGEMWQAASQIAGLMLEDEWPPAPAPPVPERIEP